MHQIDMPIDYHVWGAMLDCYKREIHTKADQHCLAKRLFCWRYEIICCKSSLILRQSYHFATVCCCSWWTFWTPCL